MKIVFDNTYEIVRKDRRKFEIFFLNEFGIKFPKVRWKNVSLSEGKLISLITNVYRARQKSDSHAFCFKNASKLLENDKRLVQ